MTMRLTCFAAISVLALSLLGGPVAANTIVGTQNSNNVTLTMSYLATYHITADGANVMVDEYDLSATDSASTILGDEFDIGNGNLEGIPSVDSPFQVWGSYAYDTYGNETTTKGNANSYLSKSNGTWYADTHVNQTFSFSAWNTETNDGSFVYDGADYYLGVGYLDYAAVNLGSSSLHTIDVANVGIVEGTNVSATSRSAPAPGPTRCST